jgi:hypothetical protein
MSRDPFRAIQVDAIGMMFVGDAVNAANENHSMSVRQRWAA